MAKLFNPFPTVFYDKNISCHGNHLGFLSNTFNRGPSKEHASIPVACFQIVQWFQIKSNFKMHFLSGNM